MKDDIASPAFERLARHMALGELAKFARYIEFHWDRADRDDMIALLRTHLTRLGADESLSQIITQLEVVPSLKHFIAAIVPLERVYTRGVFDTDLRLLGRDRSEAKGYALPLVVVVDNLRSSFNVGSILRTSDTLRVEKVFLCGYTSTPDEPHTRKTSMGVEEHLNWQYRRSTLDVLHDLKSKGYQIVAAEVSDRSQSIYDVRFDQPLALVVGNERYGLDSEILHVADLVVEVPMAGIKNSLNVGVAFGVIGFEMKRQLMTHQS